MPTTVAPPRRSRFFRRTALILTPTLGAALLALGIGQWEWHRTSARSVERLAPVAGADEAFDPEALAGLPPPVERYFRFALPPGQPRIAAARIEHSGEIRSAFDGPWMPFRSVQHIGIEPAGFVWDARVSMAPLVRASIRDAYFAGAGSMYGRLAGLIPVVDVSGTPEIAASSLMRYAAEAVWYPTALLPGPRVRWEALEAHSARATFTDGDLVVSFAAHFAPSGELTGVTAQRYRDVDGVGVLTPWGADVSGYATRDGMQIPSAGEVWWDLPEGRLVVWRGRIEHVSYSYR